jgi:hypothetical protein
VPAVTVVLNPVRQNELCLKAVAHRRNKVRHLGRGDFEIEAWIWYRRAKELHEADGWVRIGEVIDQVGMANLDIWWEPETDRLQLRRSTASSLQSGSS